MTNLAEPSQNHRTAAGRARCLPPRPGEQKQLEQVRLGGLQIILDSDQGGNTCAHKPRFWACSLVVGWGGSQNKMAPGYSLKVCAGDTVKALSILGVPGLGTVRLKTWGNVPEGSSLRAENWAPDFPQEFSGSLGQGHKPVSQASVWVDSYITEYNLATKRNEDSVTL